MLNTKKTFSSLATLLLPPPSSLFAVVGALIGSHLSARREAAGGVKFDPATAVSGAAEFKHYYAFIVPTPLLTLSPLYIFFFFLFAPFSVENIFSLITLTNLF